jgi:hypothetical protein
MNRNIKFRIYSPVDKAFYYFGVYEECPSGIYGAVSPPCQFIGRVDTNGVEIYEGDILEYVEGVELGDYVKCKGVVVYDEVNCAFGIAPDTNSDPVNYFWEGTVKGFAIVGNIFEGIKK